MPKTKTKKTYLIFADHSPEFERSMRYAALMAKANNAGLFVLTVLSQGDFQLWAGVQERMASEKTEAAQALTETVTKTIKSIADVPVETAIETGEKTRAVLKTLKNRPDITKLILTTNVNDQGKGVLLDYFSGPGASKLRVPLIMVPGHVSIDSIDLMLG